MLAVCPQPGTLPRRSVDSCTHATSRCPHRRSSPLSKGSAQTRASLSEGVTLRRLPVHRRLFENCVCTTEHDGVWACRSNQRYSMLAVCPQYCVTCSTNGGMSVVHTLPLPRDRTSCKSLHLLRSVLCIMHMWREGGSSTNAVTTGPGRHRTADRRHRTEDTGPGTTSRRQKSPSLHVCLPCSCSRRTDKMNVQTQLTLEESRWALNS